MKPATLALLLAVAACGGGDPFTTRSPRALLADASPEEGGQDPDAAEPDAQDPPPDASPDHVPPPRDAGAEHVDAGEPPEASTPDAPPDVAPPPDAPAEACPPSWSYTCSTGSGSTATIQAPGAFCFEDQAGGFSQPTPGACATCASYTCACYLANINPATLCNGGPHTCSDSGGMLVLQCQ